MNLYNGKRRIMGKFIVILTAAALLVVPAAYATDEVGRVKLVEGETYLMRGSSRLPVAAGTKVEKADVLTTGIDGKMGLILADDTVITLGHSSEFSVADFQFSPRENKLSLVGKITKGTCSFLSGIITKLSPESARIETPDATIGIRGTRLLIEVKPE